MTENSNLDNKNKGRIALLVGLGVTVSVLVFYTISVNNNFVKLEERLDAKNSDTKNVYSKIFNDLKTQGLAVDKYNDTVIKAINAAITGRYGEGGSKAAMQWIQENNPTIDPTITQKLMSIIDASYEEFATAQTEKLDIIREYKTSLRVFPNNIIAAMFGYPKKDLDTLEKIVTNNATEKAFETHKAEAINPFNETK